ncbi:ABC transporter substrate-binding protein [Paenibacillus paeoniae]|uniref:Extracellular solute-binding protein n=1 Tax=Paenibacillus paeoniae TaxID=2292705 RepID=A0A371P6Q9_9BACL|nr:extracellular solute-binding protein [Paenibacillus paeoniae]REK71208.1 extracellular solute-binding protein [Paenibacillus paeoniae]
MSKKLMPFVAILLTLSLVLTACGQSSNTGKNGSKNEGSNPSSAPGDNNTFTEKSPEEYSGEFTLWAWGDFEANVVPAFNKVYPNIKVNVEVIPNSDYGRKLQTTIASRGDMPDVSLMEVSARGALMSLDAWEDLSAAPYNAKLDDLLEYALPLITNEKGEVVTIQEDATMAGIAYKRDLAREYFGTDDPKELEAIFSNWDVFVEKGKEVYEKSGGKVTLMSGLYEEGFRLLSGSYTEPWVVDGKLNIESTFKPVYELMEKMTKNNMFGKLDTWSASWNASFANNNVIFYATPTWFVPHGIKPNDPDSEGRYGLMRAPVSYQWGGTGMSIPKDAKNKELAWQFVKWVTMSMDGAKAFAEVNNTMTLYKPAMEANIYSAADPYFAGQDIMSKFIEIGKETKARPITLYDSIITDSNALTMKMIENGRTAEQAYNELVKMILESAPELK